MFDERQRYVIPNYQQKPPFSSFLPGIAGEMGIPAWCYYNNRGQAVCSFGARDKDHAVMEFSPAHIAYRDVSRTGFRTFCKVNGDLQELFQENCDMHIGMSELEITCRSHMLDASALYFGIPGERTAALARVLVLKNTSPEEIHLELLDGLPAIVPYGLNQDFLKNMTQLAKAWMQTEDHDLGRAYFRVRASLEDGAIVREVKGGNFCLAWDQNENLLKPIVQTTLIFSEDCSLSLPVGFRDTPLAQIQEKQQVTNNQFPCCFLPLITTLAPGERIFLRSIFGQAESKDLVRKICDQIQSNTWFDEKRKEASRLAETLVSPIHCKTANPVFDAYAKQSYLDNLLRGGAAMFFRDGKSKVPFHIYSRKHGDPEREYNYFSLGQEYFAQGNGNYRDVNQNRRCDVLFAPEIQRKNIHTFFDLIQTDGYNPLVLTPSTYTLSPDLQATFCAECPDVHELLQSSFTPGQIAMAAEDAGMDLDEAYRFTSRILCHASSEPNADFGEGYWCDHWTYNLDLIETYLSVYPEKKMELLFEDASYRWYETRVMVNPRHKRYCMTENGLRQYYALDEHCKTVKNKWMHTADGTEARSTLIEKLLLLCTIKTTTLDARGMGIEMEGGRPGWYDALNGLPGLLGSSLAESCELARLLDFTADALENRQGTLGMYAEILLFITHADDILKLESDPFKRWDLLNRLKEEYRTDTRNGYSGTRKEASCADLAAVLRHMEQIVLEGVRKAEDFCPGVTPTYFTYEASQIHQTEEGIMPTALIPTPLPLFLEGPVRCLKLPGNRDQKRQLIQNVRNSGLYDQKLRMYKVNESLSGVSYEAGRALAFTPGWLENESIWLHMEYKYLLELLKNGFYKDFSQAFQDAAIPFLDPEKYGRSPLENVSFLASSANPDSKIHGRGFVARLSGSTAEFIHIWQLMFFGAHPFCFRNGELHLHFCPYIPSYLIPENGILEATFLGHIAVTFDCCGQKELEPVVTKAQQYILTYANSSTEICNSEFLDDRCSRAVRSGSVTHIHVTFQ